MNIKIEHIALGLAALIILGIIANPFEKPAAVTDRVDDKDILITCDSTVTPDIDINAVDVDNPTTAATDAYMGYRKLPNGQWTTMTLGTALTGLDFGSDYEFFFPLDATIGNSDSEPFGKYIRWTAPCKETTSMKIYIAHDETYDGLSATLVNGTFGSKIKMLVGEVETYSLKWKAAKDQYFGHPYLTSYPMLSDNGNHRRQYPNILCLKLNSTIWEEPVEVYLAQDGTKMRRITTPTIASADGAATHIMYCYEAPVIGDREVEIKVTLEADGTVAPNICEADDTAYLYGGNLYINTDTGEVEWGVEDNEASYTAGNADADELTLDLT